MKHAFFEMQGIKEDYMIAKDQKPNPYILMRFIETQLIMINPIVPHFSQYCWSNYVNPVLSKSKSYVGKVEQNLNKQEWPQPSASFDKFTNDQYMFMKDLKSTLTDTYVKFNQKLKGPSTQNCTIFVSNEYP